jgi:hypothetical protein
MVGSVIFHGKPDASGLVEVGYGVEEGSQRKGYAAEATRAAVEWALSQPGVLVVSASTPPWHTASIRVLEKSGLALARSEMHDTHGEVLVLERRRQTRHRDGASARTRNRWTAVQKLAHVGQQRARFWLRSPRSSPSRTSHVVTAAPLRVRPRPLPRRPSLRPLPSPPLREPRPS